MKKDLLASIGLLLIAAAYYAASTLIQQSTLEDLVGPTGLPTVLAALLAVIAVAIGARALMSAPAALTSAPTADAESHWTRAAGMLGIGCLYIPAADFLGYAPAIFLLLVAVMLYERMKPNWRMFVIAAGGAAFFYTLFDIVLGVRQPQGVLF